MKVYNVIMVYHTDGQQALFCRRAKPPFEGQLNFVGSKVEPGESPFQAAYRELREETGIGEESIRLTHLSTFVYHVDGVELQWFAGRLRADIPLKEEKNQLLWLPLTEDFFDTERFAGQGNIGHMIKEVEIYHPEIRNSECGIRNSEWSVGAGRCEAYWRQKETAEAVLSSD